MVWILVKNFVQASVFVVLCLFVMPSASVAAEPHDSIRKSLAFIRVSATSTAAGTGGTTVSAEATGFLVSDDGLVLTNYHLLESLGQVAPKSVAFDISIGEKTSQRRPAAVIDGTQLLDLLLLKMPPAPEPYIPVPLGSAYAHPSGDRIFSSGFPKSLSYRTVQGGIEAREGPGGYLWTVDLSFQSGQSGSPVYNADGEVIGVAKGDDAELSFMIPIDFADGLIAQVRIQELRHRIRRLEDLVEAMQPAPQ